MIQNSYNGNNSLYIIPTPIGNMEDITLRTIKIIKQVDVIFCEDTRITFQLLNQLEVTKKLISSNKYTEIKNVKTVIKYLSEGKNVGIITDRGTPIISDPGYRIVEKVINEGYNVISLPGPTALIPALTSSGLDCTNFLFYGFLNNRGEKKINELKLLKKNKFTIIFYESPYRIIDTLNKMYTVFGNRKVSVSKEISKIHETIYRGTIDEIVKEISTQEIKGEFVIVVEGNKNDIEYRDITIFEHVNMYVDDGYSEKDAYKMVSKDRKMTKSDVYKEYHIEVQK